MKSPVIKRSIVVAGHKTSVSLEEAFWHGMKEISGLHNKTLSEQVGEIDSNRTQGNLSSAIRLFVLDYFKARAFMQRFESVGKPRPESLMLGRSIELRLGNGSAASDYTRRLLQSFPESQQAHELNEQNQS